MKKNATAFVSYSWDNQEHQNWVLSFTQRLRESSVDASIDLFETQNGTTNLNHMMIQGIKNKDYIIIVLTRNYAEKSDGFQGGVGFENMLALPILRENPDKLIFVMRHTGKYQEVFPFHFKDYYAFDFSNDSEFEMRFDELMRRIYNVPRYKKAPLGPLPDFNELSIDQGIAKPTFSGFPIPNLRQITDKDKKEFMSKGFAELLKSLNELFVGIQSNNPNFEFDHDVIHAKKSVFELFVNGERRIAIKVWLGGGILSRSSHDICLHYGTAINYDLDTTLNESITYEEINHELTLAWGMHFGTKSNACSVTEFIAEIYKNHLHHALIK